MNLLMSSWKMQNSTVLSDFLMMILRIHSVVLQKWSIQWRNFFRWQMSMSECAKVLCAYALRNFEQALQSYWLALFWLLISLGEYDIYLMRCLRELIGETQSSINRERFISLSLAMFLVNLFCFKILDCYFFY